MCGTDKQDDWTSRREPEGINSALPLICVEVNIHIRLHYGGETVEWHWL